MMKVLLAFLLCPLLVFSQKKHTVGPKETLFSIGRLYQVHPRELASFNNIPFETGLIVGQVLNIPGKTSLPPLSATTLPTPAESKPVQPEAKKVYEQVPVYHTVTKKETLYQISKKNKVTVSDIKKWNRLTSDNLKDGSRLIVGYKKEWKEQPVVTKEPVVMEQPVITSEPPLDPPKAIQAAEPPVAKVSAPVSTSPVSEEKRVIESSDFFKTLFDEQVTGKDSRKEFTGKAGVFKTSSGWNDGKYYCLYNGAAPGTIIRITNPSNQQVIHARVLDLIPDIKQQSGLLIIISNAAASKLGAGESGFECSISY